MSVTPVTNRPDTAPDRTEIPMTRIAYPVSCATEITMAEGTKHPTGSFAGEALKPYERFVACRALPSGALRGYVRLVALGDSATCGIGDRQVDGSWRGWARILSHAISQGHDVSFCNLAVSGSTAADVLHHQLSEAVDHRPHIASLIVGLNDVLRSTWEPARTRRDLLACAEALTEEGAVLLTVRFHDHTQVLGLPRILARPLVRRIDALNAIYDELHEQYGGIRVDLAEIGGVYGRESWSVDRLHPSELGHRILARHFAVRLAEAGLTFPPPPAELDGQPRTMGDDVRCLVTEVVPWLFRRARDVSSWALRCMSQDHSSPDEGRPGWPVDAP